MLGIMLGTGASWEYLDDSWRSPEEVESVAGVPTSASFRGSTAPRPRGREGAGMIDSEQAREPYREEGEASDF